MLVGRAAELARIDAALAGARVSRSAALLLTGDPGIGKSALLDQAVERAADMLVLRAAGSAHDRDLAYGGLLQLLRPVLDRVARCPPPQAAALGTALALRGGPAVDRFAVGAATLTLLGLLSEDRPVAVVIDDLHDLDPPSSDAIAFAARRLLAEPVLILAAARTGSLPAGVSTGLRTLELAGIDPASAQALAAAVSGPRPAATTVRRAVELSAGNPLAVIELATHPVPDPPHPVAPQPIPAALAARFALRAEQLSPAGLLTVRILATAGSDLALVGRACTAAGADLPALAEAERVGLVRLDPDQADFRHPLMRSGIYTAMPADLRRRLHATIADALPVGDDRRAWHRCDATIGPDGDCAAEIAAVARRAAARGGHALAGVAYERAARFSPDAEQRVCYFLAAAEASWAGGDADQAGRLLSRIPADGGTLTERSRADELAGVIAARCGSLTDARRTLEGAAAITEQFDLSKALLLYAESLYVCVYQCDTAAALVTADRVDRLIADNAALFTAPATPPVATGTTTVAETARIAVGAARVMAGSGGVEPIRQGVRFLTAAEPVGDPPGALSIWTMIGPLFLRESRDGRALVQRVVARDRAAAAVGTLPHLLFLLARDAATDDRWATAGADYAEAISLARESGQTTELAMSQAGLGWLDARRGGPGAAAALDQALELCTAHQIHLGRVWARFALGELSLAAGRAHEAVSTLQDLAGWLERSGIRDVDLSPVPELVEALLHLGRRAAASRLVADYLHRARAKGQPWSLARAHRCLGLMARPDELDGHFRTALDLHRRTLDAFETARTRLAYGSRLRRVRRRTDARRQLRDAVASFETLGARPWADIALVELEATGERVRRRDLGPIAELTPQEVRIAMLLADGLTTREAGAALFLSPKTIEYHLRHVYTKLGVHSRPELTERLAHLGR